MRPTLLFSLGLIVAGLVFAPVVQANVTPDRPAASPFLVSPFSIDGSIPDAIPGLVTFPDLHGNDDELGPKNGSPTKMNVINVAPLPMMGFTKPNGKSDVVNAWVALAQDADGDLWLYMALERETANGSGIGFFELHKNALPVACDYGGGASDADLIAGCNPFANRAADDIMILFDEVGDTVTLSVRTFDGAVFGPPHQHLVDGDGNPTTASALSADQKRLEGAVNLTEVLHNNEAVCEVVNNIIPGTVTGNSDQADYKDVVLGDAPTFPMCFLDIEKDVETSLTREFLWDITKTVDQDAWSIFDGDTATSIYTVKVEKTGHEDREWLVTGNITITNNNPDDAFVTSVADILPGDIAASVSCPGGPPSVGSPIMIAANGGELVCTYTSVNLLGPLDGMNMAIVGTTGSVHGGEAEHAVDFSDAVATVNEVHPSIHVTDTFAGGPQNMLFEDSGEVEYDIEFDCSGVQFADLAGQFSHGNTAEIVETGQESSVEVNVDCYQLAVEKDANTSFTRQWAWDIEKSGFTGANGDLVAIEPGDLPFQVMPDMPFDVVYKVGVSGTHSDHGHAVAGTIVISNPAPDDALLTGVADVISDGLNATVDCPSLVVPAGGTLECTYEHDALPDAETRSNTATATQQNHDHSVADGAQASGTTDYSGDHDVAFDNADVTELDACVDVYDDKADPPSEVHLGEFCPTEAADYDPEAGPFVKEFQYTSTHSFTAEQCDLNEFTNTARFETEHAPLAGEASFFVSFFVDCDDGCTLTQGYWKTHSQFHNGGKHYDSRWENIGDADGDGTEEGENEDFFNSGQTYIQVMWTAPAGDAYYIVAHQWIAAVLNDLGGAAVPPEVQAAIDGAEAHFDGPGEVDDAQLIAWNETLTAYNEGLIGPGHCDSSTDEANIGALSGDAIVASAADGDAEAVETETADVSDATEAAPAEAPAPVAAAVALPDEVALDGVFPNPLRGQARVQYSLPEAADVTLVVYDPLGREVARLEDGTRDAGVHRAVWNARAVPSGTYVVVFRADGYFESRSVTVVR